MKNHNKTSKRENVKKRNKMPDNIKNKKIIEEKLYNKEIGKATRFLKEKLGGDARLQTLKNLAEFIVDLKDYNKKIYNEYILMFSKLIDTIRLHIKINDEIVREIYNKSKNLFEDDNINFISYFSLFQENTIKIIKNLKKEGINLTEKNLYNLMELEYNIIKYSTIENLLPKLSIINTKFQSLLSNIKSYDSELMKDEKKRNRIINSLIYNSEELSYFEPSKFVKYFDKLNIFFIKLKKSNKILDPEILIQIFNDTSLIIRTNENRKNKIDTGNYYGKILNLIKRLEKNNIIIHNNNLKAIIANFTQLSLYNNNNKINLADNYIENIEYLLTQMKNNEVSLDKNTLKEVIDFLGDITDRYNNKKDIEEFIDEFVILIATLKTNNILSNRLLKNIIISLKLEGDNENLNKKIEFINMLKNFILKIKKFEIDIKEIDMMDIRDLFNKSPRLCQNYLKNLIEFINDLKNKNIDFDHGLLNLIIGSSETVELNLNNIQPYLHLMTEFLSLIFDIFEEKNYSINNYNKLNGLTNYIDTFNNLFNNNTLISNIEYMHKLRTALFNLVKEFKLHIKYDTNIVINKLLSKNFELAAIDIKKSLIYLESINNLLKNLRENNIILDPKHISYILDSLNELIEKRSNEIKTYNNGIIVIAKELKNANIDLKKTILENLIYYAKEVMLKKPDRYSDYIIKIKKVMRGFKLRNIAVSEAAVNTIIKINANLILKNKK